MATSEGRRRRRRVAGRPDKHERSAPRSRLWQRVEAHLGLFLSGVFLMYAAWQVMTFANWNQETAQAIIQEQGTGQVLTGTLFELLAAATPVVLLVIISLPVTRKAFPEASLQGFDAWQLALVAVMLAVFVLPIFSLLFIVGLLLLLGVTLLFARRSETKKPQLSEKEAQVRAESDSLGLRRLVVPTVLLGALFFLGEDPWLPRENLTFSDDTVTVGYVLSSDSSETVYVSADDHRVHRVDASAITDREICEWRRGENRLLDKRLTELATDSVGYPACHRED